MSKDVKDLHCPDRIVVYKTVDDLSLKLDVFIPDASWPRPMPVIVWYHGGGWTGGTPGQFYPQSVALRNQGILCVSVEYRLKKKHGTTPFDCVRDAFDAMRFVKDHLEEWGGDSRRVAAGGGSAGAHLASALTTLTAEDLAGSHAERAKAIPDLLLLFNPVFNNSPEENGWGSGSLGDRWREMSPVHNFHAGVPPMLVMLGDQDALIPVSNLEDASESLNELGVPHEFRVYEGGTHGFFNLNKHDGVFYEQTLKDLEDYLREHGWLPTTSEA